MQIAQNIERGMDAAVARRAAHVVGVLALILASLGLYGVMAFTIAGRTREIGIRVAIGAGRGCLVRAMVGEGARPAALGVAVGTLLAFAFGRVLASVVEGIPGADPFAALCGAALLLAVAALASWFPGRRAARIDPQSALRTDQAHFAMASPGRARLSWGVDAGTRDWLERRFDALIAHLEGMEMRSAERFERLEQRMDALEHRMDAIERRQDALQTSLTEHVIGTDERFASVMLRFDQFEARVSGELTAIRADLAAITARLDLLEARVADGFRRLGERVDRVEAGLLALNVRVDDLAGDMRQRFRVVNDRLAELAA